MDLIGKKHYSIKLLTKKQISTFKKTILRLLTEAIRLFLSYFKEKAELFNSFFAKQCSLIFKEANYWLEVIFKEALIIGLFPSKWKKGNIAPIHKIGDKQVLKNYRSVSLLPICGKIFERLIFNKMVSFLLENNFISPNQFAFKP